MNEENAVHVLLRATVENSTEMRVWHLGTCLPRIRNQIILLQLGLLPISHYSLVGPQQPVRGGKAFSVLAAVTQIFPLLCNTVSETVLSSQAWTNKQNASYREVCLTMPLHHSVFFPVFPYSSCQVLMRRNGQRFLWVRSLIFLWRACNACHRAAGAVAFRGQSCVLTHERSFTPHVWFASPLHLSQETNDSSRSLSIFTFWFRPRFKSGNSKASFWVVEKDLCWMILFQLFYSAVYYKYICVIRGPSSNVVKIQVGTFIVSSKRKQPISSSSGFSLSQPNIYCFM